MQVQERGGRRWEQEKTKKLIALAAVTMNGVKLYLRYQHFQVLPRHSLNFLFSTSLPCNRVLELPKVLPESDLVSIGVSILRAGAIYTPGPRQASGDFSSEDSRSSTREGLPADRPAAMCEEGALSLCFTCQAQHASVGYRQHLRANMAEDNCHGESAADTTGAVTTANDADSGGIATPPGRSNVGTLDHGKAQRSKVASCLLAMDTARKKQESFSEDLEQTHFQV